MATTSVHTQSLSLCGHPSVELRNTPTGKSAVPFQGNCLNFQYWYVSSCNTLFHGQNWSFQQDSAPVHKVQTTEQWQETSVQDLISTSDWPSAGPDLYPLDYILWYKASADGLQIGTSQYESLKQNLRKAAADFPVDVLRNSSDGWPQRLKDCVCTLVVAILNNFTILNHNATM